MKTLLLDSGNTTTLCMGGDKYSITGSIQKRGETPWMSLPNVQDGTETEKIVLKLMTYVYVKCGELPVMQKKNEDMLGNV